jgi:hypothetical protein
MLVDAFNILWSLKFVTNSRHVIGSYFDELLGVETLSLRIKNHLENINLAYSAFADAYSGMNPTNDLNWKNPWAFFLDDCCPWVEKKDKEVSFQTIVLPTIVVRDFWLSPAVSVIVKMKSIGLGDEELLELILLGGYQTSWFRFFHIGGIMIHERCTKSPFDAYVHLALKTFGSITGGGLLTG